MESRAPSELAGQGGFIAEAFSDLALYLEREWQEPAPILGQSLGGVLAIRFANLYPHLVSRLILQSVNFTRGTDVDGSHASEFYGGLKRLSRRPDVFKLVNWHFQRYYADRGTGRSILSKLFGGSAVDMEALDGKATGVEAYRMFSDLYASSVFGMSADFDFVMNAWEAEARKVAKPITFIHGTDDPLTSASEFIRFAEKSDQCRVNIIPGGGHFVAATHAGQVWRSVADSLG